MIGLLIVAHGGLATELKATLEHVVGRQAQCATLSFQPTDCAQSRQDDIMAAIASVDTGQGVVVATDLYGGTPCNAAMTVDEIGSSVEVVCGVNMPMLVSLAQSRRTSHSVSDLAATARDAGRKYITIASEVRNAKVTKLYA
ncbi:MAG: PTS sugar transporter subunit IIA [Pseudomonadota bacterium]